MTKGRGVLEVVGTPWKRSQAACQGEGRGFKSLFPLFEASVTPRLFSWSAALDSAFAAPVNILSTTRCGTRWPTAMGILFAAACSRQRRRSDTGDAGAGVAHPITRSTAALNATEIQEVCAGVADVS
jgi:hypothetical protein